MRRESESPGGAARCVIVAAGGEPSGRAASLFREEIASGATVVFCDRFDPRADFVVGDGDGLDAHQKAMLGDRFIHDPEQDTNDLCKAFRFALSHFGGGPLEVSVFGATGAREDHTIGNVFHLPEFESDDVHVRMVTDSGVFSVIRVRGSFAAEPGDAFSFFAYDPDAKADSDGLEWPLGGIRLWPPWRATLNRAVKETVSVEASSPLIMFRPF